MLFMPVLTGAFALLMFLLIILGLAGLVIRQTAAADAGWYTWELS